ncbi:hypothetical protein BZA77DRAFT_301167 [Pyronema omphalodes]|nr:hypothetical protein BZA77DRAFT_301167 [Pyronema omphalodes]
MAPSKKEKSQTVAAEAPVDTPVSPVDEKKDATDAKKHRRGSSSVTDILKPEELKAFLGEDKDLIVAKEVAKLNWKMNTSPATLEDAKAMKELPITTPKVRKLHIFFGTGIHVTARASPSSKTGVTVYDCLTAIHKLYKKKADDELELPVLADIEWGRGQDLKNASEEWPAVVLVTQKKEQAPTNKKKAK